MLRALDLENAQFQVTQKDISNIGLLRHLKYVNFSDPSSYSYIYKLPRSIGKLQGLRTLNIRDSHISGLPTEICKLKGLHIYLFVQILTAMTAVHLLSIYIFLVVSLAAKMVRCTRTIHADGTGRDVRFLSPSCTALVLTAL